MVFQNAVRGKDLSNPAAYHPNQTYKVDQVIVHVKFGKGIILENKVGRKIVVVFEDETRIFVHARD